MTRPAANDTAITAAITATIAPRLLTDLLDKAVARYPDRVALDFLGRQWRYRDVAGLVERAARGLQDLGLKPGDRFALALPNIPHFVILYFAVLRVGGIVVNVNPLYTLRELDHLLRDSGAKMIATPDIGMIYQKVAQCGPAAGVEKIVVCQMADVLPWAQGLGWRLLKRREHAHYHEDALNITFAHLVANREPPAPVAIDPHNVAVLQYTGGTTGVPKAAMLTHANLTANAIQQEIHTGKSIDTPERTLAVLPLFHVFALTAVMNFTILLAGEIVLLPRFDVRQVARTMRDKRPTQFHAVPTIFVALNALPDGDLPRLDGLQCVSGGAPLPLEVRHQFEARTGATVIEGYGLSEASPIITCNPPTVTVKDNSCGRAFPDTIIEIRDPENPTHILGTGEKGEVCARGPQIMAGYWGKPEESAKVFIDGALRTGDIGYVDEDGFLFLVDRIKDVILCGGYNVYPRIIEEAAYQHPAIEEAIAIGIPDAYRGQSPKLFVKLRAGQTASPGDIRSFLEAYLSKIELPKIVEIRDSLPKTLVGKLSKKELIEEERQKAAKGTA